MGVAAVYTEGSLAESILCFCINLSPLRLQTWKIFEISDVSMLGKY